MLPAGINLSKLAVQRQITRNITKSKIFFQVMQSFSRIQIFRKIIIATIIIHVLKIDSLIRINIPLFEQM